MTSGTRPRAVANHPAQDVISGLKQQRRQITGRIVFLPAIIDAALCTGHAAGLSPPTLRNS
jgi:hypothetical protein